MPVYLDDHIDEHPKILAAGDAGAWLWTACIAYAKRYRTGGHIPKNWAGFAGRARRAALTRALAAGLLEREGDDVVVHDYYDANWSEEKRSEAGRRGAAARWSRNDKDDANRNATADANAMRSRCTSPPNPLNTSRKSSSKTHVGEPDPPDDDDHGSETTNHEPRPPDRLADVWALVADAELRERLAPDVVARQGIVGDPDGWLAGARGRAATRHADAAAKLAAEHPDWPAHRVAAELEGSLFANDPAVARQNAVDSARRFGTLQGSSFPDEDESDFTAGLARHFADDELRDAALGAWREATERVTAGADR